MANPDIKGGMRPYKMRDKDEDVFYVPATDATALAIGDPFVLAGSSDTRGAAATITRATLGDGYAIHGVVTGILPTHPDIPMSTDPVEVPYRAASTAMYVMGILDMDQTGRYVVTGDTAHAPVANDVGLNVNLMSAHAYDSVYGRSGLEVDCSNAATTSTFQLRILGLADEPDNAWGVNARLVVRINNGFHRGENGV